MDGKITNELERLQLLWVLQQHSFPLISSNFNTIQNSLFELAGFD